MEQQEYTKDYFWEIYKQLPEELKEALFSDKNNELVTHICSQAGLDDQQTAVVAKYTGRVIMGLLPLDELPVTVELELNISQELANQINRQIYISIFKHLRVSLNKINSKNTQYSDVFTSSKDGIIEKKEPVPTGPKPISKQPFNFHPTNPQVQRPPVTPNNNPIVEKPSFSASPETEKVTTSELPVDPIEGNAPAKEPAALPENPLFEEKPMQPPKIPSRDAFKDSLKDMDVGSMKIPIPASPLKEVPPMEEMIPEPIIPQESTPKGGEESDPYKEIPL
jgi:hypothetical protein